MLRFRNQHMLSDCAKVLQTNTENIFHTLCSGLALGQSACRSKEIQRTKRLISSYGSSQSQPIYKDDTEVMPGRRKKPQTLWTGGIRSERYWYRPEWIKDVQNLPQTPPSGPSGTSVDGDEKDSHRSLPMLRVIEALGRISSSTESVSHMEMLDQLKIVLDRMKEYSEHEQREFLRRMRVMLSRKRNKGILAAMPTHSPIQGAIQEVLQPFMDEWKGDKENVAAWTSLARTVGTLQWHNPSFLAESLTPDTVPEFDPFALSVAIAEVVRCRVHLPQAAWRVLLLAICNSCDPKVADMSANDKDIVSFYRFLTIIRPATCELVGLNAIAASAPDHDTDNRGYKPESYVWIVDELPEELWSETLQKVEDGMSLDEGGAARMRMKMIHKASTDVVLSLHVTRDASHVSS